jgi:membrane-bound ClpP family serine protease
MEDMKGHGHVGKGWFLLILGILLILNEIFFVVSWVMFAGIIFILAAIFMFIKGACCKRKRR